MFVDDEPNVLKSLKWLFSDEPYEFHGLSRTSDAFEALKENEYAVVVADQRMQEMMGTDFLGVVKDLYPDTLRILATAYADMEVTVSAINKGNVYRFLSKPWDDRELRQTIRNAVEHYDLASENKRLVSLLQTQNNELTEINQRLEKTVEVRTDLMRKNEVKRQELELQLIRSQKMEALGTFAGGIAHDFNNILSAIMGYTELAKMSSPAESRTLAYLNQLEKAEFRAKELAKQILSFSRQSQSDPVPLKLEAVLDEAVKLLRSTLPATITLQQKITCSGSVMASETQLLQIVMNLCTNAYHAMEENGGVLTIGLTQTSIDPETATRIPGLSPGDYLKIEIVDTGHGMDQSVVEKIFDPYFTTKIQGKGTGLGLSVAKGIIRHLKGAITVSSQLGQGTEFNVFLPPTQNAAHEKSVDANPDLGGTERILLIDDEPVLVDIARQLLQRLGYTVVGLTDSLAAVELFDAAPHRFDLVITDMTMPLMTGDQLAGKLMAIRPDIPVILCTGFSEKMSKESAEAMGIRAYVMKPLNSHELANTIRNVLDDRNGRCPKCLGDETEKITRY